MSKTKRWILLFLVSLAGPYPGTGSILAQQTTTTAPREAPRLTAPAAGAPGACQKKVGILGTYFGTEMQAFLVANGLTVSFETAATIAAGSLNNLDVLYLNRSGTADAIAQAFQIEVWVRGGGVLITEFDATELLFNGTTFGFFGAATLDVSFGVPSGSVCGGNTVNVTGATNAVATGLPATWSCSGDPIGVFKVYKESTLDAAIDRVARINVDQNKDGALDPVVGAACVDNGAVVCFFTDFGDWTPLQNPRICPNPSCSRSIEDETLMLNAVCRAKNNCITTDVYSAKFLCGTFRPGGHGELGPVKAGNYQTAVNVHNPNGNRVIFRKKAILLYRADQPATSPEKPMPPGAFHAAELPPNWGLEIDCADIRKVLLRTPAPAPSSAFIKGWVVIEVRAAVPGSNPLPLDIVTAYTAHGVSAVGLPVGFSIDIEPIRPTRVKKK